jgi:hypothetical protein
MRALLLALPLSILTLLPGPGTAGDRPVQIAVSDSEKHQSTNHPNNETYRGYYFDLSAIAAHQDFAAMEAALRHQIDIVENVRLNPHVLEFFRTIPISVNETACLSNPAKDPKDSEDHPNKILHSACYSHEVSLDRVGSNSHGSVLDEKSQWTNPDPVSLAEDTNRGVVLVRPIMLDGPSNFAQEPTMLHELLHAYHNLKMPQGFHNAGVLLHYNIAKRHELYPADEYLMTNEKEFFAVTASVFLYGNAHGEPGTRAKLKEKQPDYYHYLVYLFGFDPDRTPRTSPVASAD